MSRCNTSCKLPILFSRTFNKFGWTAFVVGKAIIVWQNFGHVASPFKKGESLLRKETHITYKPNGGDVDFNY